MFRLPRENEGMDWPCRIQVPVEGGSRKTHEITLSFSVPTQENLERAVGLRPGDPFTQLDVLLQHTHGWAGVTDPDDDEVAFSDEAFKNFLQIPYCFDAAWDALVEFIGRGKPRGSGRQRG